MYEKVLKAIEEKGLTKHKVAYLMGINPADLYHALNGKKPMYPKYRKKLSEVLCVPEDELFVDGGDK